MSLDAQRDKLLAYYRKFNGIKLIDIKRMRDLWGRWNVGVAGGARSASSRSCEHSDCCQTGCVCPVPLRCLYAGRGLLFRRTVSSAVSVWDGQYALGGGRMVLMNLANYAQFEREIISNGLDAAAHDGTKVRTRSCAPMGTSSARTLTTQGRRLLVPLAHEQEVVAKIRECVPRGSSFTQIARRLNEAKIPARRDGV